MVQMQRRDCQTIFSSTRKTVLYHQLSLAWTLHLTFTTAMPRTSTAPPPRLQSHNRSATVSSYASSDGDYNTATSSNRSTLDSTSVEDTTTDEEGSDTDLWQLVYTSSSNDRFLPRHQLNEILESSRVRNASQDITGLLLYRDGSFAQFLEGPSGAVQATFDRIEKDPRHRGVIVVLNRGVKTRDFPEWRMGYRNLDYNLNHSNADENKGQVGGETVDALAAGEGVFDLTSSKAKE